MRRGEIYTDSDIGATIQITNLNRRQIWFVMVGKTGGGVMSRREFNRKKATGIIKKVEQ